MLLKISLAISFLIGLLSPNAPLAEESRRYNVEVSGFNVGEIVAKKIHLPNGQINYKLITNVKVNLLLYKLDLNYDVHTVFDQKGMVSSYVKIKSNDDNYFTTTQKKTGNLYWIDSKQEKITFTKNLDQLISCTSSSMYFEEPKNQSHIYAEYFGDFISLSKNPDGSYKGIYDNKEEKYIYKNNILMKMVKKNNLKTMIITLIEPQLIKK